MSQNILSALPDIQRMNTLKETFLKQLYSASPVLLPALREQLSGLLDRLLATDRLLCDRVLSALVLLGNHKWDRMAVSLEQTRLQENLSEEQRETLLHSQREVLEQDALRDLRRLRDKGQEIADALAGLAKVRLPEVEDRIDMLNEQQQALATSIAEQKQQIARLDEQISAMSEVILAFEAPDLQKILGSIIPTEAELALVQQALLKGGFNPEALVSAARTFVEKLAGIVDGHKLIDVINARNRVVLERGGRIDDLRASELRNANIARELEQLPKVAVLAGLRDQWLEQAMSLPQGWTEHLQNIEAKTELLGMADALCTMEEYLMAVRRLYEAV